MSPQPPTVVVNWTKYFRIIPSVHPPINFFEDLLSPEEMEVAWYLESLTNDRLREETGDIFLVRSEDRICGKGSSILMAAFTHVEKPSRFSDGSFGVFYAGNSLETAIKETVHHKERFLDMTKENPNTYTMRVYTGTVNKMLHDIRDHAYLHLHHPSSYLESQKFCKELREQNSWGIIYNSVRHKDGECIAVLRPPAISIPLQTKHLSYKWDGDKITSVYEKNRVLFSF